MISLIAFALLLHFGNSTTMIFTNHCNEQLKLMKTLNNSVNSEQCLLNANGGLCQQEYMTESWRFWVDYQGTYAEFNFNSWNNLDFYDLSVIMGFDYGMQIKPTTDGVIVKCLDPSCPDAFHYPDENNCTHATQTGGTFDVTLCPN